MPVGIVKTTQLIKILIRLNIGKGFGERVIYYGEELIMWKLFFFKIF